MPGLEPRYSERAASTFSYGAISLAPHPGSFTGPELTQFANPACQPPLGILLFLSLQSRDSSTCYRAGLFYMVLEFKRRSSYLHRKHLLSHFSSIWGSFCFKLIKLPFNLFTILDTHFFYFLNFPVVMLHTFKFGVLPQCMQILSKASTRLPLPGMVGPHLPPPIPQPVAFVHENPHCALRLLMQAFSKLLNLPPHL